MAARYAFLTSTTLKLAVSILNMTSQKKWHVDLCLQAEVGAISSCQLADSGQLEPVKRLSNPAVGTVGMAVVFLGKTPVLLVCLNYLRIKTGVLKVETALRESNDTRSISVML